MSGMTLGQPSFPAMVGIALVNVAAADFLLYRQPLALSLTALLAVVGVSVLATHPAMFARSGWALTTAVSARPC
jgi:hypothetical protein